MREEACLRLCQLRHDGKLSAGTHGNVDCTISMGFLSVFRPSVHAGGVLVEMKAASLLVVSPW